jgi:hypothetical protein
MLAGKMTFSPIMADAGRQDDIALSFGIGAEEDGQTSQS